MQYQQSFKTLKKLGFILIFLVFVLISLGGLVRNVGAGLACPDWPLCFGKVIPPMNVRVFLEWLHRLIAGIVSLFIFAISIYILRNDFCRKICGGVCILSLVLLALQVVLGGMTVLGLLHPAWVASHLAVGLALFATLLWLTLTASKQSGSNDESIKHNAKVKYITLVTTVVIYIQAILGAVVSSNYAGLACPDFPTCFGQWIPEWNGLVKIQFLHRLGAFVSMIMIVSWLITVHLNLVSKRIRIGVKVIPILFILQIVLGIASVYLQLPVLLSVAHLAVATALFGKLVVMTHEVYSC